MGLACEPFATTPAPPAAGAPPVAIRHAVALRPLPASRPLCLGAMTQPLGRPEPPASEPRLPAALISSGKKKKGCRRRKCSKWKGGDCRCGRE